MEKQNALFCSEGDFRSDWVRVTTMISDVSPDPFGSPVRVREGKDRVEEGSAIGESGPFVGKTGVLSYVSAAQDKKVLRKYDVAVLEKDGSHSVTIPDDVLTSSTPLWEDFIVGKFLDISPHIEKIHMVLNKIWKYREVAAKVKVFEVNATTMRFRVSNPKAREKILKRGMWNIVGVPMVVSKWTPRAEEEKQEEEALPMWVHLRRVPLHMYSWEGLSFITSAVGFPVKLHPETIACTNFEEAKVFAKVDISKALPKEINFTKNGKDLTVDFLFPWLPSRCKNCDKWGHLTEVCGMGKKKSVERDLIEEAERVLIEEDKEAERVLAASQQHELGVAEGVRIETLLKGRLEDETTQRMQGNNIGNEKGDSEGTGLSLVSPTKAGKTPEKLANANQNEDFPITASKFAVLSVEEEEDGEIMDDRRLVTDTVETAVNECDVVKSGDDVEGDSTVATIVAEVARPNQVTAAESEATSNHDSDVSKENRGKGVVDMKQN